METETNTTDEARVQAKLAAARENRKAWVAALRSGKYEQAKEMLRETRYDAAGNLKGYGYCCLGVACDIRPGHQWLDEISSGFADSSDEFESPDAFEAYGLRKEDHDLLIQMNDDGVPFEAIARTLEDLPYEVEGREFSA